MQSLQGAARLDGRDTARHSAIRPQQQQLRPRLGLVARAAAADAPNDAATAAPSASRRSTLLASLLVVLTSASAPPSALAASTTKDPINRYVKRKRLDPLASYVPALLLARDQLTASGAAFAEGDATSARALLRSGAFRGVRESVRAVGEYATEAGQPGGDLVAAFLRELEALDGRMRVAEREQKKREEEEEAAGKEGGEEADTATNNNKGAEEAAVAALDALVATVPRETVERARQVVAAAAAEGGNVAAPAAAAVEAPAPAAAGRGGAADPALIEGLLATE